MLMLIVLLLASSETQAAWLGTTLEQLGTRAMDEAVESAYEEAKSGIFTTLPGESQAVSRKRTAQAKGGESPDEEDVPLPEQKPAPKSVRTAKKTSEQPSPPSAPTQPATRRGPATACDLSSPLPSNQQAQVQAGKLTDLEARLNGCLKLKNRILWQQGDGKLVSFTAWTPAMKKRLDELYQRITNDDASLALKCPTAKTVQGKFAYFPAEQAFEVFAAQVALSLHLEAKGLLPWSLTDFPDRELDLILASANYYSPILPSQQTAYPPGIKPGRDFQEAPENSQLGELNCDPRIGYRFVTGKTAKSHQNLIGATPLQTMANLSIWLRDNFGHGELDNSEALQFKLENRLRPKKGEKTAVTVTGCHSTSKLLVDLARSVNIPLLHIRTQERDTTDGHFFNRTHGGLIFGSGGSQPRVLVHTDDIYANTGEPAFPLAGDGSLLTGDDAARAYFDQRWLTPAQLKKSAFVYRLQKVVPGKGFGVSGSGAYEDRDNYGWLAGYWKSEGSSHLEELARLEQHYALCGSLLLELSCRNTLSAQLAADMDFLRGGFDKSQLPPRHSLPDYEERAKTCLTPLGGCSGFKARLAEWEGKRGNGLMR
jgi:hypothetical protein